MLFKSADNWADEADVRSLETRVWRAREGRVWSGKEEVITLHVTEEEEEEKGEGVRS